MNPLIHSTATQFVSNYYESAKDYIEDRSNSSIFNRFVQSRSNILSAKIVAERSELTSDELKEFIKDIDKKVIIVNNILGLSEIIEFDIDSIDGVETYFVKYLNSIGETLVTIPVSNFYTDNIPSYIEEQMNDLVVSCQDYRRAEQITEISETTKDAIYLFSNNFERNDETSELILTLFNYLKDNKGNTLIIEIRDKIQRVINDLEDETDKYLIEYLLFEVMLETDKWLVPDKSGYTILSSVDISKSHFYDNIEYIVFN